MFRKLFPLILLTIALFASCKKEEGLSANDIPFLATNFFENKYPNATDVLWKNYYDQYHVSFVFTTTFGGQEVPLKAHAEFTDAGDWLITQSEITRNEIPQLVLDALWESEFKHWLIKDQTYEDTPKFGVLVRLELSSNAKTKPLYFTETGKRVNKGL